ncbi:hypothetical protein OIU79_005349 [Salix purpurea]|uniref:Uncharacterized protein n=1 Tax=Salix purpurea TaxID=77065 RepID=A0A9Q0UCA8_SALPP|nr:hypothetical protein OIU79_005349 [Salix purpurea]
MCDYHILSWLGTQPFASILIRSTLSRANRARLGI